MPVIAANVGGLATIVEDGLTGYLVDGRDPQAWASRIDAVLDDPCHGAMLGAAAALRSRHYAWNTTAARLRRLYGDLSTRSLVQCA